MISQMLFFETSKAKEDSMKSGFVYSFAIFFIVRLTRRLGFSFLLLLSDFLQLMFSPQP